MSSPTDDSDGGLPDSLAKDLATGIEATILQLVADAYGRWSEEGYVRHGDHEDDFTIRIVDHMRTLRRERGVGLYPRFQGVEPSAAMFAGEEDPTRAGRVDVVVVWDLIADDAAYNIECKRLGGAGLARLYIQDGVIRFASAYYASDASSAAMVGYVIAGEVSTSHGAVNSRIRAHPSLGEQDMLRRAVGIAGVDVVFGSQHVRQASGSVIALRHLWFDMRGALGS